MKSVLLIIFSLVSASVICQEANYVTKTDIKYYDNKTNESDAYINERCKLDIYYPTNKKNFATIVWFHGGGLEGGDKFIPDQLKDKGVCIVAVNYRLYPKAKCPSYIEDAAASVRWVFKNIASFGGDTTRIFLSGHSAGGYLISMIGLDKSYLNKYGIDANRIAGLIPFSGHTVTHMTIRKENGIKGEQPIVDKYAPLFHVRKDAPPLLLITGDRELELLGRYEENAYLYRMMKINGHTDTRIFELDGYGHNMDVPAYPLLLNEVNRICKLKK